MTSSYQKHKTLMANLSGKHIDEVKSLLTVTEGSRFETNHIIKPSVKKVLKVIYRHPVYQCVHIMNSNAFIFVYNESDDKCVGISENLTLNA